LFLPLPLLATGNRKHAATCAGPEATAALAFEEMWGGRSSAWDLAALRQGLLSQYSPTSGDAHSVGSFTPSMPRSQPSAERLADLPSADASVHGGATARSHWDSEAACVLNTGAQHALGVDPAGRAAWQTAAPLTAHAPSKQRLVHAALWLPDAAGTSAAMGACLPVSAHIHVVRGSLDLTSIVHLAALC
jgi:hypothetical protein